MVAYRRCVRRAAKMSTHIWKIQGTGIFTVNFFYWNKRKYKRMSLITLEIFCHAPGPRFREPCYIQLIFSENIVAFIIDAVVGLILHPKIHINTIRPRQDSRRFADELFKCIFFFENCCILNKISLKYVRQGATDINSTLLQIMAWRRTGDKPLAEPMMA